MIKIKERSMLKRMMLAIAMLLAPASAFAADFSFTGSFDDPNEVQAFNFTVGAPSSVTLRTWSYAGGTNAAGAIIPRGGFDPILALFDSTGAYVNQNDDGGSALVPADSVTGAYYDTFLLAMLDPGDYTVTVMAFSNFAIRPNLSNGFEGGGSFTDATGNVRTRNWAFDILNVEQAVLGAVPEPATWAMLLLGFGLAGGAMRYQRRTTKAAFAVA